MVKILFVDDNFERITSIVSTLPPDKVECDYVATKNEALKKLTQKQYDLAIIDIMLPNNLSESNPNRQAGVELIQSFQRRKLFPPVSVIGVTSDDDTYSEHARFFEERLFPIIKWNPVDNSNWKNNINNHIDYLYTVKKQESKKTNADIVIITAIEEEFKAVEAAFSNWIKIDQGDPGLYFLTHFQNKDGESLSILLSLLPEMGLTAASNLTTKTIQNFSPKKVFMVGICGGIKNKVKLGDLVIANNTWDYGSGKIKPKKESENDYYSFEPSPSQISINPVYNNLKINTDSVFKIVISSWNKCHLDKPMNPELHIGPMPSGASVICDEALFKEIIKPQHRKCLAIDMETYGVYYACKNTNSSIDYLSVKSVSDYANEEKNDDYHKFCCFLSANYLKECLYSKLI